MSKVVDNMKLTEIFSSVADRFGYNEAKASFIPFPDLVVKWELNERTNNISFMVSDYMLKMEERHIEALAEAICRRIQKKKVEGDYKGDFNEAVLDRSFRDENRPFYIERKGLEKIPFKTMMNTDVCVHWSKKPLYNAGYSSTLMRVIALDPGLKKAPTDIVNTIIQQKYNVIQDGILAYGGTADYIDLKKEDVIKAKTWLVDNDYKLNEGLFE